MVNTGHEHTTPIQTKLTIVGLGLVGGSLARLAQQRGVAVTGHAHREQTAALARQAGLTATTSLREALTGADIVMLAVPLTHMAATAAAVASHIDVTSDATITDAGSVKAQIRKAIEAVGLGDRYVGAHPMAGNEHSGFAASTAELMDGAPWAMTTGPGGDAGLDSRSATTDGPATDVDPDRDDSHTVDAGRFAQVKALIEGPWRGRVTALTDADHDAAVALISHVPHIAATQLLNAVAASPLRDVALALAAGSFRDGTRVAYTDPDRTQAMITDNAAAVASALRQAAAHYEALATALTQGDDVHDFFHAADSLREARTSDGRA
ncbi:MAG: prephenate dehydrogenase/arogenate dehydrogenase family protein [Cellulomonadaceae bacterium]|jgi:prephenate dehydrogenase|nr:prephenate dehydrogenase/arogenate dehydrogenase family protein [Cellulomonadaceae bacterium]